MKSAKRTSATYIESTRRYGIYWFVALVMAPVAYFFPRVVTPQFAPVARLVMTSSILFVAAGILGTLAPRRPLRWAVGLFVPIPLIAAFWNTVRSGGVTADTYLHTLQQTLLVDAVEYMIMMVAAIVGAIAGSLMSSD